VPERNNYALYLNKFQEPFTWLNAPKPWAPPESLSPRETRRVALQHAIIEECLPSQLGDFCDVSSGSGRHAIPLISRARTAVLCDVSVDALNYVYAKAGQRPNTFFVRCDFLQSPFAAQTFDTMLCTDTLIYGRDHETRLLGHLHTMLRAGGRLACDFKCKWHTHPIRGRYMTDYSWREVCALLEETGFAWHRKVPYYQEATKLPLRLARLVVPPTRYFVLAEKA